MASHRARPPRWRPGPWPGAGPSPPPPLRLARPQVHPKSGADLRAELDTPGPHNPPTIRDRSGGSDVQVELGEPAVAVADDPELVVGDRLDLRAVERPVAGEGHLAGRARLAGTVDPDGGDAGVARLVQPQHLAEPVDQHAGGVGGRDRDRDGLVRSRAAGAEDLGQPEGGLLEDRLQAGPAGAHPDVGGVLQQLEAARRGGHGPRMLSRWSRMPRSVSSPSTRTASEPSRRTKKVSGSPATP